MGALAIGTDVVGQEGGHIMPQHVQGQEPDGTYMALLRSLMP